MLTQEQRDTFRRACASYNASGAADVEIDEVISTDERVVETAETIDQFFESRGRRLKRDGSRPETPFEQQRSAFGTLYVWDDQQSRKGARRGTLYVMDFGSARACFFDGEV